MHSDERPAIGPASEAYAGQAVYTTRTLRMYDKVVVKFSNSVVWRCPAPRIIEHYSKHVASSHLDIGPGSGYYLEHCRFPVPEPRLTLLDPNPSVLRHAADRVARYHPTHKAWQVGTPYDDRLVHELRTIPSRRQALVAVATSRPAEPPEFVPAANGIVASAPLHGRRQHTSNRRAVDVPFAVAPFVATLAGMFALVILVQSSAVAVLFGVTALPLAFLAAYIADRYGAATAAGALLGDVADRPADLDAIARAVADGLHLAELVPLGAASVRVEVDPDGTYRASLSGVSAAESQLFVTALDEVLAPLGSPRYVIPRYALTPPANLRRDGRALLKGTYEPDAVVYHAVPSVLAANAKRAAAFEHGWARWVSNGKALYTGSPDGAGVLAAQRGLDPFAVTTVLRVAWA